MIPQRHDTTMIKKLCCLLLFTVYARTQTCDNYGVQNGTDCACPTGFGGSTCAQPGCGGTIFQGSQRPLASLSGSFANLTASNCSCEGGWTGTGCNVCQTASACQSAFAAVSSVSASTASSVNSQGNDTMVCNREARVWASSQMSCRVEVRSVLSYSTVMYTDLIYLRILLSKQFIPSLQP